MPRIPQVILIASTVVASWFGVQAIHEAGHVFGAWLTGGRVAKVVLHPLTISRTDLDQNPHPLAVVWAGPVVGVLAPLVLWLIASASRASIAFLLRFFAGFCLVANGAYIGVGAFWRIGDCGEMLRTGSAIWQLVLFGAVTISAGFWLWNGQGPHFGPGRGRGTRFHCRYLRCTHRMPVLAGSWFDCGWPITMRSRSYSTKSERVNDDQEITGEE